MEVMQPLLNSKFNFESRIHAGKKNEEMDDPRQIIGKVYGATEIVVEPRAIRIGKLENLLVYYRGKVRCGMEGLKSIDASIVGFQIDESDRALDMHNRLSLFSHPGIMKSLGYGYGTEGHSNYIFLAFPCFEGTLANYMDKTWDKAMDLKRFTEEFIGLIGCIAYALLELHNHRYYCPNLSGKQIIIQKEQNSVHAKLWDFSALELGNEKGKDMDWVRLGDILRRTAHNHKSYTPEIADLCEHMRMGTLKGIDILRHPALLFVRGKFDNMLALNTFALTHCKESSPVNIPKANLHCSASEQGNIVAMNELFFDSSDKDKTISSFEALLDSNVGWKAKAPLWIKERITELGFTLPKRDTFRYFLWAIRCLIEHENSYVPPEAIKRISSFVIEFGNIQPDLEYEIRESWSYLFLVAQKFVLLCNSNTHEVKFQLFLNIGLPRNKMQEILSWMEK